MTKRTAEGYRITNDEWVCVPLGDSCRMNGCKRKCRCTSYTMVPIAEFYGADQQPLFTDDTKERNP